MQDAGITTDVELVDLSREMGLLSLQGPLSRPVLRRASPDTDWGDEAFPPNTHRTVEIGGHKVCFRETHLIFLKTINLPSSPKVRAMRVSFVGELGWEFHCPSEACVDVYRAIMAVETEEGGGGEKAVTNAAYRALDSLSAEKGYPHWHVDIRLVRHDTLHVSCNYPTNVGTTRATPTAMPLVVISYGVKIWGVAPVALR